MELRDLIVTPIYLIAIYVIAYVYRLSIKDTVLKKYFIPALTLKLIGAISLGMIYQFYYGGGDTFNYFNESKVIYTAFSNSIMDGFNLIFDIDSNSTMRYIGRMQWYHSPQNMFVVRSVTILGLLNFHTYSSIACLFAIISFSGLYKLSQVLIIEFPNDKVWTVSAIFFLPSVFFWGSGIMKDTIIIGCLGWAVYGFYTIFILRKFSLGGVLPLIISLLVISIVKPYVVFALLPSFGLWAAYSNLKIIKNRLLRLIIFPFILIISGLSAFYSIKGLTAGNNRYSMENLLSHAAVQQNYLQRVTNRNAELAGRTGSLYEIEHLDGSLSSVFTAIPSAINVAFFRPYFFETQNIIMILSVFEPSLFIFLLIRMMINRKFHIITKRIKDKPIFLFFISFSIIFGVGVGLTSGNFGTLVRYRILFQPFLLLFFLLLGNKNVHTKFT